VLDIIVSFSGLAVMAHRLMLGKPISQAVRVKSWLYLSGVQDDIAIEIAARNLAFSHVTTGVVDPLFGRTCRLSFQVIQR